MMTISLACPPRYSSPRTASRATFGPAVAAVAGKMGQTPMPHQSQVLNTALEVDDQGQFVYRTVVLTVPRQGSKTTTVRWLTTWWGIARARNLIISTAQTGADARLKFLESFEDLENRPWFARQLRGEVRRANGTEKVTWRSGTRHRPSPPTPKKGHGDTLDLGVIDEAWAFKDEAVITAMRPAMMTRNSQLWIVSTAGTDESVLLRRHVEMGRRAVTAGQDHSLAYFEWSAEDDADPDDPRTWWSCIPTLGHLVSEQRIADDKATMKSEDFERSYLNRWVDTGLESVVPWGSWLLVNDSEASPQEPLWLSVDINPERTWGSIVAAGSNADGTRAVIEVIESREGVAWIAPRVEELRRSHNVAGVVIDGTGPAAVLESDLLEPPVKLPYAEVVVSCQALYDAIVGDSVTIRSSPILTAGVRGAVKLGSGDGAWRWGRRRSKADISALMAATLSWWRAKSELGTPSLRVW